MTTRQKIDAQFEGWSAGELYGSRAEGEGPYGPVTATVGNTINFKFDVAQTARVKEIRDEPHVGPQIRVDIELGQFKGKNRWIGLRNCWNDRVLNRGGQSKKEVEVGA